MLILVVLFSLIWIVLAVFLYKSLRKRPGILLASIVGLAVPGGFLGMGLQSLPILVLTLGTVMVAVIFMKLRTPPNAWRFGFLLTALAGVGLLIGGFFLRSYFDQIAARWGAKAD